MSVRRRRLSRTGIVCVALWIGFSPLTSPALDAVETFSQPAAHASETTADALAVTLRPPLALCSPGEAGVVVAHRGDSSAAPENTLPAFAAATAAGADYFEVDLRMSKDSIPMAIHDATVDRTTDGTGVVADMTAARLRALDAGSWFSESFTGTPIPTVDEVLAHVAATGTGVVIEYKGSWGTTDVRAVVDRIRAAGLEDSVVSQSFSRKTVANFAEVAPTLPVGWLTETVDASTIDVARRIGADAVNARTADADAIALAHRHRVGVFAWTHDADAEWEALTAIGVDGIITNRPEALRTWVTERQASAARAARHQAEPM